MVEPPTGTESYLEAISSHPPMTAYVSKHAPLRVCACLLSIAQWVKNVHGVQRTESKLERGLIFFFFQDSGTRSHCPRFVATHQWIRCWTSTTNVLLAGFGTVHFCSVVWARTTFERKAILQGRDREEDSAWGGWEWWQTICCCCCFLRELAALEYNLENCIALKTAT